MDPDGRCPFLVITGLIGAVVGAVAGGIYSYTQTGQVDWAQVGIGAAAGGVAGLTLGAGTAAVVAGSATASTSAVLAGLGIGGAAATVTSTGYWTLDQFSRGWSFERLLGGMCNNFPVIDKFINAGRGLLTSITSIKSMDILAASYQKGNAVFNTIMGYVSELAGFFGTTYQGTTYTVATGVTRILELVIRPGMTTDQLAQIHKAIIEAAKIGVQIIIHIMD